MKSRIGQKNTHMAGENLVALSGVFLYCNMARWNLSVARPPCGFVLSIIIPLIVLTPTSAQQLP